MPSSPILRALFSTAILLWLGLAIALFFASQPYFAEGGSLTAQFYGSELASQLRNTLMPWLSAQYQQ